MKVLAVLASVVLGLVACQSDTPPPNHSRVPPTTTHPSPPPAARNGFSDLRVGWSDQLSSPPEVRSTAATVWTGQELLVWSGYEYTGMGDERAQGDGFRYDSVTDTWDELPDAPLSPRIQPVGAWSGTEFLVWGGWAVEEPIATAEHLNDGAAFNPITNEWRMLPPAPIDGRTPLSVWTGRELIVWGTNYRVAEPPTDGAAYDPENDEWRLIADGPIELTDATAVWTGEEMIVFGAELQGGNFAQTPHAIGAAYHPQRDMWRELPPSSLSPQASTVSWNGQEMIAWDYENQSAAYNPISDTWRDLPRVPLDAGECSPSSVGVPPLIYGDYCGSTVIFEPTDERWLALPGVRNAANWDQELVAADPVLLLLAHNLKREDRDMFAFKPSFPRGVSKYHLSLGNIIHRDGRYRLSFAADWEGKGEPRAERCVARGLSPTGQVVDTIRFRLREEGTEIERLWPQMSEGQPEIASLEMTCRPLT